jgi:hypothetical protein
VGLEVPASPYDIFQAKIHLGLCSLMAVCKSWKGGALPGRNPRSFVMIKLLQVHKKQLVHASSNMPLAAPPPAHAGPELHLTLLLTLLLTVLLT